MLPRIVPTLMFTGAASLAAALCFNVPASACITYEEYQAMNQVIAAKESQKKLVEADNALGLKLLAQLRKAAGGKNVFISPLSIAIALQMTYNGAAGDTAKEMAEAMGFAGMELADLNSANKDLRAALTGNDKLTARIANAIFASKGEAFSPDFLKRVNEQFGASIEALDFKDPATVEHINKWCADNTNDKIKKIVDSLDDSDRMLLCNAVYFKANWKTKFEKDRTRDGSFFLEADKSVEVPMMSQTMDVEGLMGDDFMAGKLMYEDGHTAMYLFIPDAMNGLDKLMEKMTPENFADWRGKFTTHKETRVYMPRFKLEYESSLSGALQALGMKKAFSSNADLSGMRANGAKDLSITDVLHKTYIDVNEEGTEAAAVTAVKVGATAARRSYSLTANRPFFYAIVDDTTGSVMFMGTMTDPSAK